MIGEHDGDGRVGRRLGEVLALCCVILAGCQAPRTELMIGVATDLHAPNLIDRAELLVARVKDGHVEQQVGWDLSGARDVPFNLPGSFGIYSDGEETRLDLVLTGYKGANEVVSRRAVMNLVEGQTLFFRMSLAAGCVAKNDCPPSESCVEGVCRDAEVNSLQLPEFTPELVSELSCDSGTAYIDTSTGMPMQMSPDASMCPGNLCSEGTCLKPPPPPSTEPRRVQGSQSVTHVEPGQTVNVPDDLSALTPMALVPDGQGGFTTLTGSGSSDGSFVIEDVPPGSYYLQIGTSYYVTTSSLFDLGSVRAGRANAVPAAAPTTTQVVLNATGLSAWVDGDFLEVIAPAVDDWWFDLGAAIPITPGATALTSYTFTHADTGGFAPSLIMNDKTTIAQMTQATAGALPYLRATRAFLASPFSETSGGTTTITGAFLPVAQTPLSPVGLPLSQWDAAMGWNGTNYTSVGPLADDAAGGPARSFGVFAQPGLPVYGNFSPTADYMFASLGHGSDVVMTGATYGTSTPAGEAWTTVYAMSSIARVRYLLPGTTQSAKLFPGIFTIGLLSALPASLSPRLTAVRSPTIAGRDLFVAQSGFGTTPTIAWQPPATGTATQVRIAFHHLTVSGSATVTTPVATLFTTGTSVQVPPGVLVAGEPYAVEIRATDIANPAAPRRQTFPSGSASIASAIMTP